MPSPVAPNPDRLTLPRSHRLTHARQYDAVYAGKMKKGQGPMLLFGIPNELPFCRLGIAIGKRSGPATTRSRLKRLSREAFRLLQHDLPRHETGRYDLVISLRPTTKPALDLAQCQALLATLTHDIHDNWEKRKAKKSR